MKFSFEAPKNTGYAFGCLFRSILIESNSLVKIIGFNLEGSNIVPSDGIIDTVNLSQKLSNINYELTDEGQTLSFPLSFKINFTKKLMSSDLKCSGVNVTSEDVVLVETTDDSVHQIEVVLDRVKGFVSSHATRNILAAHDFPITSFTAISSRNSDVKVNFDVTPGFDCETVLVSVEGVNDANQKVKDAKIEIDLALRSYRVLA